MTAVIASLLGVLGSARERSEAVRAARVPRELGALHPSKRLFPDDRAYTLAEYFSVPETSPR